MGCSDSKEREEPKVSNPEEEKATNFRQFLENKADHSRGAKFRNTNGFVKFREGVNATLQGEGYEDDLLDLEPGTVLLFKDITPEQWELINKGYFDGQKRWLQIRKLLETKERWDILSDNTVTTYANLLVLSLSYHGHNRGFTQDTGEYIRVDYIGKFTAREAWEWRGPWWFLLELLHDRSFAYDFAVIEEVMDSKGSLVEYRLYGLEKQDNEITEPGSMADPYYE